MVKLLVTGSRGLIGRELIRELLLSGIDTRGFDWAYPPTHPHYGDLLDPSSLHTAVQNCDGIIHLAAISRVSWGERDPRLCDAVNAGGTKNIIEAALRARPDNPPWFILASSREVYGEPELIPVREDAACAPFNVYGHSKLASERVLEAYDRHLPTAILRFANVYGAVNDHPDRVVPAFLRNAIDGRKLEVRGADNAFDFTHVRDVVRGIMMMVQKLIDQGETQPPLHFATGRATTLGDLADLIVELTGSKSPIEKVPTQRGFVSRFVGDPSRAADQLGFRCEIGLETGLANLAVAMREPVDMRHTEFPDWRALFSS